jgi:hypothetical protein
MSPAPIHLISPENTEKLLSHKEASAVEFCQEPLRHGDRQNVIQFPSLRVDGALNIASPMWMIS